MSKQKLSALLIVYNEIDHITDVLDNLSFADEIVVVDSFSTDGTVEEIKKRPEIKLYQRVFDDYTSQRNYAIEQAANDWILFIDADERVTPKLEKEIIETIAKPDANDAYFFYRKFMFCNKPLHFSGWQTDKIFRLFKKEKASYVAERLVHETLKVDGSIGKLKHKLIHYSYSDYESYKHKMLSYGRLRAKELYNKGKTPTLFHRIIKPAYKFINHYIFRLGILDGKRGYIICYLNALGVKERYVELSKLQRKKPVNV
ncbi:glycosyltransferase family 2 protein [Spongiivirga citrea]|uniref:glycosyltransferase family 2 protein n=1 Tax=Spongiivirga citrea TaxID=1481457 RepID=UPI0019530B15|nr:glycosyltransferase family 2 protein [Spongiivirga citrea]